MLLELNRLSVPPGQRVLLKDVSWQEFETILEELGEHRATRLAYSQGTLEIMNPLPEHEKSKGLIGDFVKILLEEFQLDCEAFGSTTFKRQDMAQGLEPDESFYIQNHTLMIGKDRIDLTIDPPPDLAIEIDITSRTPFNNYETLRVPELWRYDGRRLQINLLQDGKYIESLTSPNFPGLPLAEKIPQFLEQSKTIGRSPTLRAFRAWLQEQLN